MIILEDRTYGFKRATVHQVAATIARVAGVTLKHEINRYFSGDYYYWNLNGSSKEQIEVYRNAIPSIAGLAIRHDPRYPTYRVLLNWSGQPPMDDKELLRQRSWGGRLLEHLVYEDSPFRRIHLQHWDEANQRYFDPRKNKSRAVRRK